MKLISYFKKLFIRLSACLDQPYKTILIIELPKNLKAKTLYVINEDGFLETAALKCPCGCKKILYMNLLPDEKPCWLITQHKDGTATLHPSVWRQKDCKSHFWFRKGRVEWCS